MDGKNDMIIFKLLTSLRIQYFLVWRRLLLGMTLLPNLVKLTSLVETHPITLKTSVNHCTATSQGP